MSDLILSPIHDPSPFLKFRLHHAFSSSNLACAHEKNLDLTDGALAAIVAALTRRSVPLERLDLSTNHIREGISNLIDKIDLSRLQKLTLVS